MSGTKLKAVTIKWLNAHLGDKLAKSTQNAANILVNVMELLTQIANTHLNVLWLYSNHSIWLQKSRVLLSSHESQLPWSSVNYYSAFKIFNLREDTLCMYGHCQSIRFMMSPNCSVGKYTSGHLHLCWYYSDSFQEKLKIVTRIRDNNEEYSRVVIDQILVNCLMDEKIEFEKQVNACSTHIKAGDQRSSAPTLKPSKLTLQFESNLSMPIVLNGETRLLLSRADCTLCDDEASEIETNLVIVEVKKLSCTGALGGQIVSYMGKTDVHTAVQSLIFHKSDP